jgi:hypothetical protein
MLQWFLRRTPGGSPTSRLGRVPSSIQGRQNAQARPRAFKVCSSLPISAVVAGLDPWRPLGERDLGSGEGRIARPCLFPQVSVPFCPRWSARLCLEQCAVINCSFAEPRSKACPPPLWIGLRQVLPPFARLVMLPSSVIEIPHPV